MRDKASIDVLIPRQVGERLPRRTGATGSPTVQTPGGTQALQRSEAVAVQVAGRHGHVRRPNPVGALIMKAAAHTVPADPNRGRHRGDFATLAAQLGLAVQGCTALGPRRPLVPNGVCCDSAWRSA
jgi:hypothetical protein